MLGQIDAMCRDWGAAKRRILLGTNSVGDPSGWPTRSILGKIREEAEGAANTPVRQFFQEVMYGNALDIARALDGISFGHYSVAWIHYVIYKPVKRKVLLLAQIQEKPISVRSYWLKVDGLHHFIQGRLCAQNSLHNLTEQKLYCNAR